MSFSSISPKYSAKEQILFFNMTSNLKSSSDTHMYDFCVHETWSSASEINALYLFSIRSVQQRFSLNFQSATNLMHQVFILSNVLIEIAIVAQFLAKRPVNVNGDILIQSHFCIHKSQRHSRLNQITVHDSS